MGSTDTNYKISSQCTDSKTSSNTFNKSSNESLCSINLEVLECDLDLEKE